jgi:hypothetical protein
MNASSASTFVISSKSDPELFKRLNSLYESQLRIHRLKKLSLSVLNNSKNRAKLARKKSKK